MQMKRHYLVLLLLTFFLFVDKISANELGHCPSLFLNQPFQTKTIELYPDGKFNPQYTHLIKNLTEGDRIDFGDGQVFTFKQLLGQGATTFVVETDSGLVLRIPKEEDALHSYAGSAPVFEVFINDFVRLHEELKSEGIPVVDLNLELSRPPRFLVVSKIPILFNAKEFFFHEKTSNQALTSLSPKRRKQTAEDFIEFAKTTWKFRYIGDLDSSQIGYDGTKWILFDFAFNNQKITSFLEEKNAFSKVKNFSTGFNTNEIIYIAPPKVTKQIKKQINKIRKKQSRRAEWIQREGFNSFDLHSCLIPQVEQIDFLVGKTFEVKKMDKLTANSSPITQITLVNELGRLKNSLFFEAMTNNNTFVLVEVKIIAKKRALGEFYQKDPYDFNLNLYSVAGAQELLAYAESGADFQIFAPVNANQTIQSVFEKIKLKIK